MDEYSDVPTTQVSAGGAPASETPSVACPNCGYRLEPGTPICGDCGHQLYDATMAPTIAAGGTGPLKFVVVAFVLLIMGGVGWAIRGPIADRIEEASDNEFFSGFGGSGSSSDDAQQIVDSPYRGVRDIAVALKKGGLPCTQVNVDHADEYVATGSCQAPGNEFVRTHVQINIYYNHDSLALAREIMRERVFNFVHDANWFVITQQSTAKKVHKILGGELVKAK